MAQQRDRFATPHAPPPLPELGSTSPAIAALELHQAQAAAAMPWQVAVRLKCLEVTATTCGVRTGAKDLAAWAATIEEYALNGAQQS